MKITDTGVTTAGVFRCCVGSVATEYLDKGEVEYSDRSRCKHCGREFELVNEEPHNVWIPVDTIKQYDKIGKQYD